MNALSFASRECPDCHRLFYPDGLDGLCPPCRSKQDTKDLSTTTCPRCKEPMEPKRFRLICPDCSTADLLAEVEKWGSE